MKARRGSTASPMSTVKISSASTSSSIGDLEENAGLGVHGGVPELGRVHLSETLVALDSETLLPRG